MSVTIRRIPDDEPDPIVAGSVEHSNQGEVVLSSPGKSVEITEPSGPTPPRVDPWAAFITQHFGARAPKILAMSRCPCGGRLRPYTEPKTGSAANRDYGVKPMLRCAKCGRSAS